MRTRTLAVGHDAYRAGAQIVFLNILRWLREHRDDEISLVLASDGELLRDYERVLPTTVLPGAPRRAPSGAMALLPPGLAHRLQVKRKQPVALPCEPGSVDLIYANSLASARLAASLATELGCPVVCHVHELEMSIQRFTTASSLQEATRSIGRYIAVSRVVERNLVENHGIDPARIECIPPGIPIPEQVPAARRRSRLEAELGIPPDAFVVGGCGTVDWRKAPDVFLLVAKAITRRAPERPVHFVWVGGEPRELPMVEHDLERLGLRGIAHFVGPRPDPAPYFSLFDAFLLTSREDPFPLVCLEAASMAVPIVCFADAGGMPELVEDDAGFVVPYLDVEAAAERLLSLASSERTRTTLGRRAAAKVAERCSIDVVGPQIASVLDRSVTNHGARLA
jgi:glycosyltransferase involved in cell wall biosynthesis